jgi:DNA (cytosine-5)-methyltransferase 1
LDVRHADIHEFIRQYQGTDRFIVDILHLSPPCQPFSPANTTPNAFTDAMNHATFTAIEDLIRLYKPRVVTLEETSGLSHQKHRGWFRKLLSSFVNIGYSVGWRILYSVPQTRKRPILVGSR